MDINRAIAALDNIDDCLCMGENTPYPYGSLRVILDTLVDAANKNNITLSEDAKATIDFIETFCKQENQAFEEYMAKSDLLEKESEF